MAFDPKIVVVKKPHLPKHVRDYCSKMIDEVVKDSADGKVKGLAITYIDNENHIHTIRVFDFLTASQKTQLVGELFLFMQELGNEDGM